MYIHVLRMYVLQKQVMGGVSVQKVCSLSGADTNMSTEQFLSSLQVHI